MTPSSGSTCIGSPVSERAVPPATSPVRRRDRPWLQSYPALITGPFESPSADDIRSALARLIEAYPHCGLNRRLDGRRWVADRWPESIVVEDDGDPSWTMAEMLDATWRRYQDRAPLTFVRYPNHIGMVLCHALGDGSIFVETMGTVAHTAFTGELATWGPTPSGRFPLLTAGVQTFGRRPSMIRTALADKFPLDEPVTAGAQLPWRPSRRTVGIAVPNELCDEAVEWGRRFTPPPSRFALLTSGLLRAMAECGIAVSRDVHILVDLRKYLGKQPIDGNFIADVPMRIGADTPPEEISAKLRTTLKSGRPLANAMLTSTRAGSWRRQGAAPTQSYDPERPLTVTVSSVDASAYLNGLPFFEGGPAIYTACGLPEGPHGVTFGIGRTHLTTAITACFHDNVIDPALLQQALDRYAADPARLVCRPRLTP